MIGYLLVVPVVIVAGYIIARHHHRLRDLGIGTALGTAVDPAVRDVPSVSDVHGHADDHHPGISDGTGDAGPGDWDGGHDSTSAHGDADF